MALTRCTECDRQISDKAAMCPGCGAPLVSSQYDQDTTLHPFASNRSHEPSDPRYSGWASYIRRHWRGDFSLARSYWLNNLLIAALFNGLLSGILSAVVVGQSVAFLSTSLLVGAALALCVATWGIRGTWRAATKHKHAGGRYAGLTKTVLVLSLLLGIGELERVGAMVSEHWHVALSGGQLGPETRVRVSTDGQAVTLSGGMNEGAAAALARALELAPNVRVVVLSSAGGWMREGQLVGRVIAQKHLDTHVEDDCSSACTVAFLAGKRRSIAPDARIGFHPGRTIGQREADLRDTRALYAAAGLSQDFVEHIVQTPVDSLWYPTASELLDAHVITPRDDWDAARAEVTEELSRALLANLGHVRLPRAVFEPLLECKVNQHLAWLNASGCGYFMPADKTAEQYMRERNACFVHKGYVAAIEEIDARCAQEHIPNDWAVLIDTLAASFAAAFDPENPSSQQATALAACVTGPYVERVKQTGCAPFKTSGRSSKDLFPEDGCLDRHREALGPFEQKIKHKCLTALRAQGVL